MTKIKNIINSGTVLSLFMVKLLIMFTIFYYTQPENYHLVVIDFTEPYQETEVTLGEGYKTQISYCYDSEQNPYLCTESLYKNAP